MNSLRFLRPGRFCDSRRATLRLPSQRHGRGRGWIGPRPHSGMLGTRVHVPSRHVGAGQPARAERPGRSRRQRRSEPGPELAVMGDRTAPPPQSPSATAPAAPRRSWNLAETHIVPNPPLKRRPVHGGSFTMAGADVPPPCRLTFNLERVVEVPELLVRAVVIALHEHPSPTHIDIIGQVVVDVYVQDSSRGPSPSGGFTD